MTNFTVANGQIIGPNGQPFFAEGIDVWASPGTDPTAEVNQILSDFPNINMVRIAAGDGYSADSAAALAPMVNALTSKGIVVEIGDYNPAFTGQVPTGSNLAAETAWFSSLATAFIGNPYVWFSTANEPEDASSGGTAPAGSVSAEQLAVYNAIRATGSNAMIGLEGATRSALVPSDYAGMTNVQWDDHLYNWQSNYSSNPVTIASTLQSVVAPDQAITSAEGAIPIILGEFGDSSDGNTVDGGGQALVQYVTSQTQFGWTAWGLNSGGTADQLTNPDGTLTATEGQVVAAAIASGPGVGTAQTQAQLNVLAGEITAIVNAEVPGGELFNGTAYPITFDVGDINVANLGSVTDKDGDTWTLTPGAQWWYGGVAENGTQLWTGYNIAMRLVNGDAWVEEAKFGGWWNLTAGQEGNDIGSRPGEGGDPGQSTSVTGPSGTGNGAILAGTPGTTQTQAQLDTLAAQITTIVNTEIPGGELFSGVAYPITFDVGDVNVENFGSLTDKDGNTWTLTPGAQWWYGGVAENGTQLWTGYNIAMRLVNGDAWVEEAKFGGWWNLTAGQEGNDIGSRPGEGGDPGQSTSVTGPSGTGNGAIVIVPGSGSFKDAAGNVYTLDAAGNADENGKPVPNGSGTGTMELANGLVYGQDATSKSWYTWNGTGWATSGAPPAVTGGGTNPSGVVTGTGSDSLVLSISEDAYQGDAQFTVSVDGKQLGGTFATTAIHGAGQEQTFTFNGDWAPGQHTVAVDFLNDAYGGTAATDRNLYVGSETYDGVNGGKSLTLDSAGTQSFAVTDTTALPAPPLPTFPTATDGFVTPGAGSFNAAGNAYSIDGSGKAVQNGAAIPGGGGTSAMAAVGSSVYGQDSASGQWYSLNGTNWTATAPMLIDATSTGSINEALPRSGTVTENGDTFVMSSGNVIRVTLSTGNDNIGFIAASKVTLTGGSGNAQVLLAGGTNTVTAGSGSLDATAGGGADAYVFHSGGGLLTVEDFSLAKGDTLTIDKSLQGSMVAGSDGHGGTALVFASSSAVDLKGVSAAPTIHWN